jgi:IQ calmodulin-binding motif
MSRKHVVIVTAKCAPIIYMPLQMNFTSHILVFRLLIVVIRGANARHMVSSLLKKTKATSIIQKYYRGWAARKKFAKIYAASVVIQSGNDFFPSHSLEQFWTLSAGVKDNIYGLIIIGSCMLYGN